LVLYQITQDDRIAPQLGSSIELLKETLNAHRVALSIDQQNADVLFNTAQVLTTISEELTESEPIDPDTKAQAISLLQEAVELFSSCLTRQEMEFSDLKSMQDAAASAALDEDEMVDETSATEEESSNEETPEQWATVVEPVTAATLLDTAIAELHSLSMLAIIVAPAGSSTLATITELATPIISHKLQYYISLIPDTAPDEEPTPTTAFLSISGPSASFHANQQAKERSSNPRSEANMDANLAVAKFTVAIADAEFRSNLISMSAYGSKITDVYDSQLSELSESSGDANGPRIMCEYADALITFADTLTQVDSVDAQTYRWQTLTSADGLLKRAIDSVKSNPALIPEGSSISKLYIQRGDIELQRWRLASSPSAAKGIASGAPTLLKNAGVYYRGALGFAEREGDKETAAEGGVKAGVVGVIERSVAGVAVDTKEIADKFSIKTVKEVVGDMLAEGLIDDGVGALFGGL
jgi:hypothetical protein